MTKLEYIWVDGGQGNHELMWKNGPQLRSKTKILDDFEWDGSVAKCPVWGFDGSSTNQAPGENSDCVLRPERIYENPLEENSWLVLCGVWNTDDTPHKTNTRHKLYEIVDGGLKEEPWFGFEQEYTLFKLNETNHKRTPVGWPINGEIPHGQGDYYCGRNAGEDIARDHMDACINAGIGMAGINSEVMLGQWEYQIFGKDPYKVTDDLWVARWILEKICLGEGIEVSLDPKPVGGDWNGAGCHANFSTKAMREEGGDDVIHKAIKKLEHVHDDHIEVYGAGNQKRLTGSHETCSIREFKWGVSDRGASIRIPWQVAKDGKGYLEDRRPSANCDPYLVAWRLIKTICGEG